jgi:hypothetical protein
MSYLSFYTHYSKTYAFPSPVKGFSELSKLKIWEDNIQRKQNEYRQNKHFLFIKIAICHTAWNLRFFFDL